MFYWPPFKAGPRAMDVPELDGLPPKLARRIGDECTFRASFSWAYGGALSLCTLYFLFVDDLIAVAFNSAPLPVRIMAKLLALVGGILGAYAVLKREKMWQYRREVRAYLAGHGPSLG